MPPMGSARTDREQTPSHPGSARENRGQTRAPGYARWGKARDAASSASFAAGVPIEILVPSPG